jgi:hypothetical protein
MRRALFAVVAGLVIVALVAPIAAAAQPAPSFGAKASAAAPGGPLSLQAKVLHPVKGSTFSASAVVHFDSGDAFVALTRRGKSFVAGGKTMVPLTQPVPSTVAVDVTIWYNGVPQYVPTFWAVIELDT